MIVPARRWRRMEWVLVNALRRALRALWWRRGLSAAVLGTASVVIAVAVAGPMYNRAAKESILQDTLRRAPSIDSGLEFTDRGASVGTLQANFSQALATTSLPPIYGAPIAAVEEPFNGLVGDAPGGGTPVAGRLVWREGAFGHVQIQHGRAPRASAEVIASAAFLDYIQGRLGQRLSLPTGEHVTVVGVYAAQADDPFWFSRPYFGALLSPGGPDAPLPVDALFGTRELVASGLAVLDLPLRTGAVRVTNAAQVSAGQAALQASVGAQGSITAEGIYSGVTVTTDLPRLLATAARNEQALATPVLLIVVQLLLLCGLVLFGAVRSSAEARAPEVALLKLRGYRRGPLLFFGMAEPALLIPAAFPIGIVLAYAAVRTMAAAQFVVGTPVVLDGSAALAGATAVAGAAVATMGTGLGILRRPIAEQWRRAQQRPSARRYATDALAVIAALAGLVAVLRRGGIGAHNGTDPLALSIPALLAIVVAIVVSRLLPLICRGMFRRTAEGAHGKVDRRGGVRVGAFLAVRQIARRPATLGVVVLLVVAFTLATFAISAYSVAQANRRAVASATVGAATVVNVSVPRGSDLGALVNAADPGGRQAMAVIDEVQHDGAHHEMLGVQPARFAAVATWRGDYAGSSRQQVAAALQIPGLNVVHIVGSALRVPLTVDALTGAQQVILTAGVVARDGLHTINGPPLPHQGAAVEVIPAPQCTRGCDLTTLSFARTDAGITDLQGAIDITGIDVRGADGRWLPVASQLSQSGQWRPTTSNGQQYFSRVVLGPAGLHYSFHLPWETAPALSPRSVPSQVPVVATQDALVGGGAAQISGLDGQPLPVEAKITTVLLPRAGRNGVLVDRAVALRAADQQHSGAVEQVWLTEDADPAVLTRLNQAGVQITQVQSTAQAAGALGRQGPPLALLLFLVGAAVAALLALTGTALTLYLGGRRRGFELAALQAIGITRRSLRSSLLVEQGTLLGCGVLFGIGGGLAAALLVLPSVPEFTDRPPFPNLLYTPPYLLVLTAAVLLALVIVVAISAACGSLVRRAHPEFLREAAP